MSLDEWSVDEIDFISEGIGFSSTSTAQLGTVRSLFPGNYSAYARVLHPAYKRASEPTFHRASEWTPVKWSTIAYSTNRIAHPAMEWNRISYTAIDANGDRLWDRPPSIGTLPVNELKVIVSILRESTESDTPCWFAFAEVSGLSVSSKYPRINTPSGPAVAFSGTIDDVFKTFQYQSPNYWGTVSSGWMVATEIDLMSTYFGGSEVCANSLAASPELEAWRVEGDQGITSRADTLNPSHS